MKKLFLAAMMLATVSAQAQSVKVFNGSFEWTSADVVEKQLNVFSDEVLTITHVKVVTGQGVTLYDRDLAWSFNGRGDVVTLEVQVENPLKNFIERQWDILVTYEQGGETFTARYRQMHTTMYDIQPHSLADGIFIPYYGMIGDPTPVEEEDGTTTQIDASRMSPRDRFESVYRVGMVEIRDGKKVIVRK